MAAYVHVSDLSDELLIRIFEFALGDGSQKREFLPLLSVCSRWMVLARPLLYRTLAFAVDDDLRNVVTTLEGLKDRGVETFSWIRSVAVHTNDNLTDTARSHVLDDLERLLLHAGTLEGLIMLFQASPALLAVPARICAESLRDLCLVINPDALDGGAVTYINAFKRLSVLQICSYVDWARSEEALALPNLTHIAWFISRRKGSDNDLAFLLRSRFGEIDYVVFFSDSPQAGEGAQPGLLGQFLVQYPRIKALHLTLGPSHWSQLTKAPAIEFMDVFKARFPPNVVQYLPSTLRKLHAQIAVEHSEHLWSFLEELRQAQTGLELLQFSFELPRRFTWEAGTAPHQDPAETVFTTRLLEHARDLGHRGITILDQDHRSAAS